YARALAPRTFDFPTDHGPHPDFRSEWWYVTGNLTATDGRDFGFQLTIFRSALAPEAPVTGSAWGTNQAYMAHFTVTDVAERGFHVHERFARGAVGLAGATTEPLRVWLEDWAIEADAAGTFPLDLRAAGDGVALRLELEPAKPLVLQGEDGLSRKGPEPGNASYYYSFTRLLAEGALTIGGEALPVTGTAWLDREWSTSALSAGLVGWDWFALQLADGWDLMIYRLREADGGAAPESEGVLVDPAGRKIPLVWGEDVVVGGTGTWSSPVDGAVYPSGWRIRVPARGWDLEVEPRIPDQELDVSFRYWEGAVSVRGTGEGGEPVAGRGYVELTGYAGEMPER
ncbi:MAG TPA: lipocalin-like domain-containing protein, partial [Longimicrobiales bacterium]|nr:lipocalin-like domain-containing protein [Longimicrobiales bacterium]